MEWTCATGLLDLPADVLEMIMLAAAVKAMVRFLRSCRRARSLIEGNAVLWKRRVVADFGFPGVAFEPATSLSCPRWQDVYLAHYNLLNGRYELFVPSPTISAPDPSYNPADDIPNAEAAVKDIDPFPDDPNAPSSPASAYDSDNPDHVIDADEVAALLRDVNTPVSTLVAPGLWDAHAVFRVPGKLTELLDGLASLRAFPKDLIEGRVTRGSGPVDRAMGGGDRPGRLSALGYNDTFDLFLGRTGNSYWVAEVERGGGLGVEVWRSALKDNLEPLDFRGDVIVLEGVCTEPLGPIPPLLRVGWGLGGHVREYDLDVTVDAAEAAEIPTGSSIFSTTVWMARVDGDLMAILATVSYSFDCTHTIPNDGDCRYFEWDDDGSYSKMEISRGESDIVLRRERRANVMLVYAIDRRAGSVKFLWGHDVTKVLHRHMTEYADFRHKPLLAEDIDPDFLKLRDVKLIGCDDVYMDVYNYDDSYIQYHVVCFDLTSGAVPWSTPFAEPPNRIGPISRDGSAVLLQMDGSVIGMSFRKVEDGEGWGADRYWNVERVGIGEYPDTSDEADEEEDGSPGRKLSIKSLVFKDVGVWIQERVDGRLENHMLYFWEPFDCKGIFDF
ncbi:hypothetical protein HK101_003230 [Irineochytrium annulatum]|nr:hypothetical protein HK101_003230 [Irineochytrium annulatum]